MPTGKKQTIVIQFCAKRPRESKMAGRMDASQVIRPFNGEGDVSAWLAKVELVASLTEVKDVAKLLPLYFEGGPLSLYLELDDSKKGDYNLLSKELQINLPESLIKILNFFNQV